MYFFFSISTVINEVLLHYDFHSQKIEQENKDTISARKVQKADREKLRRDKLNEQFSELGNTLGTWSF